MYVARRRSPWFVVSVFLALSALAGVTGCKKTEGGRYYPDVLANEAAPANKQAAPRSWHDGEPSEQAPETEPRETEPLKLACNDQETTLLYLSPDDSNSMSSPAQIRDRVLDGGSPYIDDIAIRP